MIQISTIGRLSLGLVLLTISILFGADMLGLIPDRSKAIINQRQGSCESLAVYCAVEAKKGNTASIMTALKMIVKRNDDILSAAIRKKDGSFMVAAGDHIKHWKDAPEKDSTPTHVRVPIFEGEKLWGNVEVSFSPVRQEGIAGLWANTLVKLVCFVILVGTIVYRLFLKRTLQHLDPSSVVPPRVKSALDALAEGVLIMDQNEQVVLANTAFAKKVGMSPTLLLGGNASEMTWTVTSSEETSPDFPWTIALREGESQIGVRMSLPTLSGSRLRFMVNCAPITDGRGRCKGVLATFDDVTQLETKHLQLQDTLKKLEKSQEEIRRKNVELEIMATHDPLTNCLNRRAFFERFRTEVNSAKRYGHDVSCIMVDIDHFKDINDTYGHAAGDQVLKELVEIIQKLKRDPDIVCRYGGEEFCVALPFTDLFGAVEAAERFRHGVESHDFSGISITASFGVSSMFSGADDITSLLGHADDALYIAKDGGRNCVESWGTPVPVTAEINTKPEFFEETVPLETGEEALAAVKIALNEETKPPSTFKEIMDDNQMVGEDSHPPERNKEALELVSQALDNSSRMSSIMGLRASLHDDGKTAVQLNQNGGWGDGGEIEGKDRRQSSSISKAADVLKGRPKKGVAVP